MSGRSDAELVAGLATGVGSLPHLDAQEAASSVLRVLPEFPFAPQLPCRSPRERMLGQWLDVLPEVEIAGDGSVLLRDGASFDEPFETVFDRDAHGGLLAFVAAIEAGATPPPRVKVQCTGPLTLGEALHRAGMPAARAFARAAEAVTAWVRVLQATVRHAAPAADVVVFLDEPGLVGWADDSGPIDREAAVDHLSGALAAIDGTSGVHVCGAGDAALAVEAGPRVVGVEVRESVARYSTALVRHLDAGGWLAWGAVPTDRPVGDGVQPLWRSLAELWCELARRGCDPVLLRARAVITPACGLAGHGRTQAERALTLASELGARVLDQALAARLTLGA